ncbi:O-antigen/teichoic acid export membrane protein [Melghirimyces profundicolus]|uniref:O-antigen/teichoic acid export membrane protein n=2 Tax=Melghirimyces profundicolus TaxID=1242148 RepID=A0A2T6BCD0_9BACL|nr:O-antigen/teichoic acid export membrane protein [Melghirimyces profundicolus]
MGSRIGIQAVYFVIIARALGSEGYGSFVGVAALVAILAPYASLGTGNLIIKHVSRDPGVFRRYWGNALAMTLFLGGGLVVLVLVVSRFLLPSAVPTTLIVTVSLSDIVFARMLDVSSQAFQGFQRMERVALLQVLFSISRLGAALGLLFIGGSNSPEEWGWLYLLSTAVSALIAMFLVCKELGFPGLDLSSLRSEVKEGFYFAVSLSAQGIHNDIDKTMLARLSTLQAAGIYAAAYRIIDVAFAPARSLIYASYARFFQHGANGINGSFNYAKKLLPIAGGYGLFAGCVLFVTAPILPYVLGDDYRVAVEAIRWLALIPLIRVFQYFGANVLTGAGYQGIRSLMQVSVAVFNGIINLYLIPAYSWQGAAVASLVSDGLLALVVWGAVWHYRNISTSIGTISEGKSIAD